MLTAHVIYYYQRYTIPLNGINRASISQQFHLAAVMPCGKYIAHIIYYKLAQSRLLICWECPLCSSFQHLLTVSATEFVCVLYPWLFLGWQLVSQRISRAIVWQLNNCQRPLRTVSNSLPRCQSRPLILTLVDYRSPLHTFTLLLTPC